MPPDTDDNWQPPSECKPGGCRMWEVQQQIRLLRKQLRHEMRQNAEWRAKLKVADRMVRTLQKLTEKVDDGHEEQGDHRSDTRP